MKHVILVVYIWFGCCNCFDDITLKPFHLSPLHNKNLCEEDKQSTIVEDFFNTVFAEFPASQPSCVCIQLCVGHPTYCYPNGCFKYIQGYVKDRTNSTLISITLRPDIRNERDNTARRNEETDREKSSEYMNNNEDLITTYNFRKNTRCKIGITPRNRIFSVLRNPFRNRFQLSSYLKKSRRQNVSRIDYYERDNAGKTIAPLNARKISTHPFSVHYTKWPQVKDTVELAQAIGEWGTVLDRDETNASSTFNFEERTNVTKKNAENELSDELSEKNDSVSSFDLHFMSYVSNDTESGQKNPEVIPVKENATTENTKFNDDNFTSDFDTQNQTSTEGGVSKLKPTKLNVENQNEKLDSITNILLNATEKENEDYSFDTAKGKSLLFRRLPWFDVRRLKNQIRRKNRLGHLAHTQRFGNKKRNYNLDLESDSAVHEYEFSKNRKRDYRTVAELEQRINNGDIEML